MSVVTTKTFDAGSAVFSLVVWNDSLVSGDRAGNIKQWNHEGECVKTFNANGTLVVWNDSLVSGDYDRTIKQWNHEGVCVKTFASGCFVQTLVVWNDSLFSGSDDGTIKQWVDEEWEAQRQREQDIRNLLLVYSRSMPPELNEDIVKEIATYF